MKSVLNLIKSYNTKATESQVAFLHSLHEFSLKMIYICRIHFPVTTRKTCSICGQSLQKSKNINKVT